MAKKIKVAVIGFGAEESRKNGKIISIEQLRS